MELGTSGKLLLGEAVGVRGGDLTIFTRALFDCKTTPFYSIKEYLILDRIDYLLYDIILLLLSSRSRHCWRMASTASSTPSDPAPFSSTRIQLSPRSHLATSSSVFLSLSSPLSAATPLFFLPT